MLYKCLYVFDRGVFFIYNSFISEKNKKQLNGSQKVLIPFWLQIILWKNTFLAYLIILLHLFLNLLLAVNFFSGHFIYRI